MKSLLHLLLLPLIFFALCSTAFSQRTVRMNIERMITDAAIIIRGTVMHVESRIDQHTNILSTFVTIAVKEDFYGAGQSSITLKMIGGKTERSTLKFSEMPVFKTGEEIFSLFYPPSKYGFTSPVGMGQGKFSVLFDQQSKKYFVRNALNNARLFEGVNNSARPAKISAADNPMTIIEAEEFSNIIRSFVTLLKK